MFQATDLDFDSSPHSHHIRLQDGLPEQISTNKMQEELGTSKHDPKLTLSSLSTARSAAPGGPKVFLGTHILCRLPQPPDLSLITLPTKAYLFSAISLHSLC